MDTDRMRPAIVCISQVGFDELIYIAHPQVDDPNGTKRRLPSGTSSVTTSTATVT